MFTCKVCAEKEARISDLLKQVELLQRLTFPPQAPGRLPLIELEANKILSGDTDDAVEVEADSILDGTQ